MQHRVGMQLKDMLRKGPQGKKQIAQDALPPAQLLFEQLGQSHGNRSEAECIVVDIGSIAFEKNQVSHESVFALVDGNAKPVPLADHRLDPQQQFAPDGEEASADAAYASCPVFRDLIKMKRRIVDERLDCGDSPFIGVPDAHPATYPANVRFAETCREFTNSLRVKNAIGVHRDDNLGRGPLEAVAHGAGLAAVDRVASDDDADVGEIPLRPLHPQEAVVDRAVVLGDDFEPVIGIVAATDALNGFIDGPALVVAGQNDADCRLEPEIFPDLRAGNRPLKNGPEGVFEDRNQQRKKQYEPDKCQCHGEPSFSWPI